MFGNALFFTSVVFLALAFWLMDECRFLIPYRNLIWMKYASDIAVFAGVLFVNLFAAFYAVGRKLFLKDTGRKLAHLEKELRRGNISEELSRRLQESNDGQIH